MPKNSDFMGLEKERRKSIKAQAKQQEEKHKMRMIELKYSRETDRIKHENDMTKQRIRTVEVNRLQTRKEQMYGGYKK